MEHLAPSATAALAHAFGLGTPEGAAVLADHGERGRIWRLATDRGTWAVKQLLTPSGEIRAAADVAFQEAAAAAGISLPHPVRTRDGRALLDGASLPDGGLDGAFRTYAWVDLDRETSAGPVDFGRVTAALHRLDLPATPEDEPWWGRSVDREEWPLLVAAGAAARESWAERLGHALPDIRAMAALVTDDDPAALRLCHRDLSVLNVRRTRDGGLTVLDWDSCGPAEPVREIAVLVTVYSLEHSPEGAVELYAAYVAAGGPARVRRLADFSPVARGMQTLVRLYAGQTLDASLPAEARSFARERLGWVLGTPMLPRVTALLAELERVNAAD